MDIKQFVKLELQGWEKPEIIGLIIVLILIFLNAFILNDSPIAIIYSICGILATILAGKGKISCYLFGGLGSCFYIYLSFKNAVWGNALLNLCYYLPMDIIGVTKWIKHLDKHTNEIIRTKLNKKEAIISYAIILIIILFAICILYYVKDSHPIIDGITTILSIFGMYLTVKRCIEQWFVWMVVNGLSTIMWTKIILNGEKAYAAVLTWFVYFLLSIYFYKKWRKIEQSYQE